METDIFIAADRLKNCQAVKETEKISVGGKVAVSKEHREARMPGYREAREPGRWFHELSMRARECRET